MHDFGVVIIARDEEHNIGECLVSLHEAGIKNPLVVVDSRTKDKTADLALKYTSSVSVIDGSRGRLRNTGYKQLGLPFVAYIDADMAVMPGYLETLRLKMDENPKLAVVGGIQEPLNCCLLGALDCEYCNYKRAVSTGGAFFRVEAIEEVGGFSDDLNVGEDGELINRLLQRGWLKERIDSVVIGHNYAPNYKTWRNKIIHGKAAGFHSWGVLRLLTSPFIGLHAAWVRRQPHLIWYVPFRSLTLLLGPGLRKEYTPTPSNPST